MVAGGEARPVTLSDLDLDLRSQVFWPRHTMDIPGTPSQMWKLSQIRGSAAVILCRFGHDTQIRGIALKNLLFPWRMLESGFLLARFRAAALPKRRARARSPQPPRAPILSTRPQPLPKGPQHLPNLSPSLTSHLLPSWLRKSESAVGCFNLWWQRWSGVGTASESPAGLRRGAPLTSLYLG